MSSDLNVEINTSNLTRALRLGFYQTWDDMQGHCIDILNQSIDKALNNTK